MSDVLGAPGWKLYQDKESGRPYYHQEFSGTTRWQHPLDPAGPLTPPGHEAVPVDGAPGWLIYHDGVTARSFYHNPNTGATSWEHPLAGRYSVWLVLGVMAAVPLLLLLFAIARRHFLAVYHPEMLRSPKAVERDRAARRQASSGQGKMRFKRPRWVISVAAHPNNKPSDGRLAGWDGEARVLVAIALLAGG